MMQFRTEKVTDRITRIIAPCQEMIYVVEGSEKAVLIDTGSGFGDLKNAVEEISHKPLTVLLTHGHVDHAMGSGQFENLYMSKVDEYIYLQHGEEAFRKEGILHSPLAESFEEADYIPTISFSKYSDLEEGNVFSLGEISVEIFACPGHTKGSMVMLIPEERILITGDACNNATFMFEDYSTSIVEYKRNLEILLGKVKGKYDRVLTSHHGGEVGADVIESVIEVCQDIIDGNTDDIPLPFKGAKGLIAKAIDPATMKRVDGKTGNIAYSKEKIHG